MKPEWLFYPMPTSEDGCWQLTDSTPSEDADGLTALLVAEADELGYEDVTIYLAA